MIFHQISLSLGRPKAPSTPPPAQSLSHPATHPSPDSSTPLRKKSPRSPSNRAWVQEQQRRVFLQHLKSWSCNHDSSPYFHGTISIAPRAARNGETLILGKSISCILTDSAFTDARKLIVIRLFPPQEDSMHARRGSKAHKRGDSVESVDSDIFEIEEDEKKEEDSKYHSHRQARHGKHRTITNNYYKLVIRCGSGWITAREYFSRLHFTNLHTQSSLNTAQGDDTRTLDDVLATRSLVLGDPPSKKDAIAIQPLFHPFLRLPPELQELILMTSASLFGTFNMCPDTQTFPQPSASPQSAISLSTLLRISTHITQTLHPYILASTTFHFGLTGFTNFLWQLGPTSRPQLRHLTFHFGKMAILHCVRWLAPDHVFELFDPPVVTDPRSLQFFWRCQVRDLTKELHLTTLTIDVRGMAVDDIPMVTRCVRGVFGSVELVKFVETLRDGKVDVLKEEDRRVVMARKGITWREGCRGYLERYLRFQYFMRVDLLGAEMEVLEREMVGPEWDE